MGGILITGANGMLGRNLRDHPRAEGRDLLTPGRAELDLADPGAVRAYVDHHRPDAVIHAAGKVGGIRANMADPVAFLDENLTLGRNVLVAAREAGVARVLNLSSSCVYPRDADNPLREEQILSGALEPTNEGYALAKIVAMRLCQYINAEEGTQRFKSLIPCNLYGPHDKFDPVAAHLIPAIIAKVDTALRDGAETVEIWGDGTARREFMYAGDAADGIWSALDRFDELPEVMNLGLGHDHSVNDYYAAAARVMGWQGRFTHDLSKPTGMKQKLVDISRQTEFGWAPSMSLDDGIARTGAHYRDHWLEAPA